MGTATLGYPGGPSIAFRLDPESIDWTWQVLTNVVETIGGRVIQVLGARLDDVTIQGSMGQDHSVSPADGQSWVMIEKFVSTITAIMEAQSADANVNAQMHPPATFSYPPRGWRFSCYVKALTDPDNGNNSVILTPGKINQRYSLTLFVVQDASAALVKAGTTNGAFSQQAYNAIGAFMARISDGIGWHFSQYNGQATGTLSSSPSTPASSTAGQANKVGGHT